MTRESGRGWFSRAIARYATTLGALCLPCLVAAGCGGGDETRNPPPKIEETVEHAPPSKPFVLPLPIEDARAGWIALFDGESLFGWTANNDVNWAVEDGVITADSGDPGLLLTTVPFADFRFRCEYKLEAGGNSGVFLRSLADPTDPTTDCYEFNFCDTHEAFPTGSLVGRKRPIAPVTGEDGAWHEIEVHCEGRNVFGYVDGRLVVELTEAEGEGRRNGFIGLQKNAGRVAFRNVGLLPLGTRSLFDGESLDGWREVPGSQATFEVVELEDGNAIRVEGGAGFLETQRTFGDFLLQFDARTLGHRVNSGVFFRAETGTEDAPSNGYELQVHNGVADGDRSKPNDYGDGFGTGAIFRRQAARAIVADDETWCTVTLVAAGPRFATWVNGYRVVDFLDERDANDNPRKGLRLAPGHLSLQGHDETTRVEFRNLDIAVGRE